MDLKTIATSIHDENPDINSVCFVGCGASMAELYPGHYFLQDNARMLRSAVYSANEFVHATPASVGKNSIVITCSLGGNTPETVEASKKALSLGAKVIALTHTDGSPLSQHADFVILHGFEASYAAKLEKMTKNLQLAVEILNLYEGYEHYENMLSGFIEIYPLINQAVSFVTPAARKFAEDYKDAPVIYVMSSGPTEKVAYSFSICLLMEMQWMNSGSFHDGEFFHGPFEIVEKGVPFILLMNDGRTRALDSRALDFLNRFEAMTTVIDAKDYGLSSVIDSSVKDYFNPILIAALLRVHAEQLSIARKHPLTKRRYMWKLEY